MNRIFVIGAGRSTTDLIQYLLDHAEVEDWEVVVGDLDQALAAEKIGDNPRGKAIRFDAFDEENRRREIEAADLVVSLLPPKLHVIAARDCLELKTNLVTASYVSDEMLEMDEAVKEAGLIFMNEVGADPGIDHMSAMDMISRIKARGGNITAFRSYCGAVVAPESSNLWGYKFTWAPRNIILAGKGIAQYRRAGKVKYLPYHHLFRRYDEISVPGYGAFEAYANRNSLVYAGLYGLEEADTIYRATLRYPGFCDMWQAFVEIGLTDERVDLSNSKDITFREFLFSFINEIPGKSDLESLAIFLKRDLDDPVVRKIEALGLLGDEVFPHESSSAADVLQYILMRKWVFGEDDVDLLVMQHQLEFELDGERRVLIGSMVDKGRSHDHTAISRTVGLPTAMCVKLILNGQIEEKGVRIPNFPSAFEPILKELEKFEIEFKEEEKVIG